VWPTSVTSSGSGQTTGRAHVSLPAAHARRPGTGRAPEYLESEPAGRGAALVQALTTTDRCHPQHAEAVSAGRPWDWRILANGRLTALGYERGQIDTSLPFPELKARSDITEKAKAAGTRHPTSPGGYGMAAGDQWRFGSR